MTYCQDVQSNKQIRTNTDLKKWKKIGFQRLFTFSTGKNIKQNQASPDFSIPCVRYGELYHMYNEVITDVINYTNLKKEDLIFSEGNEILLPSAGEDPLDIGSASALMVKGVAIGRTINVLKPLKDGVYNQSYVAHYISHILRNNIARLAKGTSISNVYNSDLKQLKISLPPLKEQQKIAQILSQWDEAIETTQNLIEQLQLRKKGLMQELLSGKKRLVGFNEKWKEATINQCLKESKIPSRENSVNKRISVKLNLKGIVARGVKGTEAINSTAYFIRKAGQFVYGKQNLHKGAMGIIPKELNNYESTQDIPTFDFKDKIDSHWFLFYVSRPNFYLRLENISTGTGSKRIHPKSLFKLKIKLPSIEEQKAISKIIGLAATEIEEKQAYLWQLKQQKKGLMQQLLTGKKRVKLN